MTALKRFSTRVVISLCAVVLCLVAVNWLYPYHEVFRANERAGEISFLEGDLAELSRPQIYLAGWPSKFYMQVQYDDLPPLAQFSWTNLAIDLALGCAAIAFIFLYEWRLHRGRAGSGAGKKRQLTIVDLLVCTGLLASVIAYWRGLEQITTGETELASEIVAAGGTTVETVHLPRFVARVLPEALRQRIRRVSEVTLREPSSELLTKAIALPYLTRLSVGGGQYDLQLLKQLADKPLLSALRVSGRRLEPDTVASIAGLEQLQSLNLMRTNITAKALAAFGDMPRLQSINLIHTDVALSEIGTPGWSKTVRTLRLPHPPAGRGDRLTLEGWRELRSLECNEYDERINDQAVTLNLKELPMLSKLSLDALQLFDLHLDNLPKLAAVEALHSQWKTRASQDDFVRTDPWIRNLTIAASPELRSLSINVSSIEQMRFDEPMTMRLTLGTSRMAEEGTSTFLQSGQNEHRLSETDGWLKEWGDNVGPNELSFAELDLSGLNLAPLSKSKHLRSLDLSHCRISPEQLQQLRGMEALQELNLEGCLQHGNTITWLAANLPNVQRIVCDPFSLHRLKLENNSKLEKILLDPNLPLLPVDALKIVAMPNLQETLDLPQELWYLHIEDAPSLTGLSTRAPWPDKAVFKGVRDLTYFTAGGERLGDSVAEAVLTCSKLESLTLAHSSVSPDVLSKVGALKSLNYLALSGSQVDDDIIARWQPMPGLRALRLDDTAITDKSIDFILTCGDLEHLSLRNTQITDEGLARLSKLNKLSRVDCGGEGWSVEKMKAVCMIPSLAILDLSYTEVTPQMLAALQENAPRMIRQLNLRNSQVDGRALVQLARENSAILFDLTEAYVDGEAQTALTESERVLPPSTEETEQQLLLSNYMQVALQKRFGVMGNSIAERRPDGMQAKRAINPRVFAPDPLEPAADSLSQFDRPDFMAESSTVVVAPSMSVPALIGYAIGNLSKTFSAFATQGDSHVEY